MDNKLVHFSHKKGIMAEMYVWFLFLINFLIEKMYKWYKFKPFNKNTM